MGVTRSHLGGDRNESMPQGMGVSQDMPHTKEGHPQASVWPWHRLRVLAPQVYLLAWVTLRELLAPCASVSLFIYRG